MGNNCMKINICKRGHTELIDDHRNINLDHDDPIVSDGGPGANDDEDCADSSTRAQGPCVVREHYKMDNGCRGIAVIIVNHDFQDTTLKRPGAQKDIDNLKRMFEKMGFTPTVHENKEADDMKAALKKAAKDECNKMSDCFACAILSTGKAGDVDGMDEEITIPAILRIFNGKNCASLRNKPKLFFIQTCSKDYEYPGAEVSADDIVSPDVSKIPIEADFLIVTATPPGSKAWMDENTGSWFVDALCKVVSENCFKDDMLTMLTGVNRVLMRDYGKGKPVAQVSSSICMLRKKLTFQAADTPYCPLCHGPCRYTDKCQTRLEK